MKTYTNRILKILVTVLLISVNFGCSNNDSEDVIEEPEVTKCDEIKVLDTDEFVANTDVSFGRLSCSGGGCGFSSIITKRTDLIGRVCISLTQSDFERIQLVSCSVYNQFFRGEFNLDATTNVIYVYRWL